jgi:hypothetical protein
MRREDPINSKQEMQRELCRLFERGSQGDVDLGIASTYVCRFEGIPDREVVISELAKQSG